MKTIKVAEEISGTILQTASGSSMQTGEIEVGLAWDFMNVVDGCVQHSGDQK